MHAPTLAHEMPPCCTQPPLLCRIEYAFDSFYLVLGGSLRLDLSAIVRGGGWTEACYLSEDMRIMNNSQGDTLVFVRADDE